VINNPEGYPLVEVEWVDSSCPSLGGWHHLQELIDDNEEGYRLTCHSAGYLVRETPEEIWVASSYFNDHNQDVGASGIIVIPVVSIVNIDRSDKMEII
jgi:hypothetical protein